MYVTAFASALAQVKCERFFYISRNLLNSWRSVGSWVHNTQQQQKHRFGVGDSDAGTMRRSRSHTDDMYDARAAASAGMSW